MFERPAIIGCSAIAMSDHIMYTEALCSSLAGASQIRELWTKTCF